LRQFGVEAICGDAENPLILKAADIHQAKAVIVTTGVLKHLEKIVPLVKKKESLWFNAFDPEVTREAEKKFGVRTVSYAEASTERFLEWLALFSHDSLDRNQKTA
jgi:Trk K+ transport system NAD-binding subunit